MARAEAPNGRITGRRLQERRLRIWTKNPNCAQCNCLTAFPDGFELDHIVPLIFNGKDIDDNCQILCGACHRIKSVGEGSVCGGATPFPEWLEPAACDLTIVFGPPGSGKSTWISERAGPDDLIIDLDEIIARLSGEPIYAAEGWLTKGLQARNSVLGSLKTEKRRTWFIATGNGQKERQWWIDKLVPSQTVVLDVAAATCIDRILKDPRRQWKSEAQINAVYRWWAMELGHVDEPKRKKKAAPRVRLLNARMKTL
jgi:shikimate kinase